MSGFDDLVRQAMTLADDLTETLQVNVTHEAWIDDDGNGDPVFATAVARPALVQYSRLMRRDEKGFDVLQHAQVTFIQLPESNGTPGRREPVDPRDQITLPDGYTGPILNVKGLVDPETNRPYFLEVSLG